MSKATRRFIVNKVLEMLITLVVVTLISFLLVRLSPIDPAEAYARRSFAAFSFTDEQMEALREDMGLNDPLPVQYVTWVRDALHLDFGKSFVSGQPVFEKVTTAIGITVTIVLISAVIQAVFILLFGCLCYLTRKRMIGHALIFLCIAGVSMERQIIETLRMHTGLDKKQAHALAENVLRQVNLTDTKRVLSAYPGELSGGMLQRIAMALILGTKPKYVLADEPTSALDEANRDLLLELLRKYQKTAAILFISHDTEAMKALCPITHVMERGKIIETQATEQLFIHPQQPWTKRFAEAACHREEVNWKWTALN